MTEDEIMAMVQGMKLNLLIATKIFGWIIWEEKRGEYLYIVFQKPDEQEPYKRQQNWESIAGRYKHIDADQINEMKHIVCGLDYYSSDISAAWEVVERLRKQGLFIKMIDCHAFVKVKFYELTIKYAKEWVEVRDVPEAICKAALLAMLHF